MEIYLDPEEKIMCPYNNSHHIRRKRMNTHLVKCKKSYPDAKLVECDFNVDHKIPEPELQYHHEKCPDRRKMEILVYQEEGTDLNKFPIHNVEVPTEESWDDLNVPSYDPKKYVENKDILRHMDVESAAKRRDFRIAERKRVGQINANSSPMISSKLSSSSSVSSSRPELPPPRRQFVHEETPESVTNILSRLKLDANRSYIPQV